VSNEHPEADGPRRISRRRFLAAGASAAAGLALSRHGGRLIDQALDVEPSTTRGINEVEHVVILMQENRSFDHYFGTLSTVRGFSDKSVLSQTVSGKRYPIFDQFGYTPVTGVDPAGFLQPFHLLSDPPTENGETTNDITHSWAPQHESFNSGQMNEFVEVHVADDGPDNGFVTMGYFTRADLAFYYALADAFTICDMYFCSVLGPTDPNRLMSVSASIERARTGGPSSRRSVSARSTTGPCRGRRCRRGCRRPG
jgi:phospholipase C